MKEMLNKWLFGKPGGLFRTRSLVTLIVVGVTGAMWLLEIDVTDTQNDILKFILTFYFVTRVLEAVNGVGTEGIDQPTKPPAE